MRKAKQSKAARGTAVAKTPATRKLSEVLELLLKAITERVPGSGSKPGLVLSWLDDKEVFYGSVVGYGGYYGKDKKVLWARQAQSVMELVRLLGLELVKESELDKLKRVL